MSNSTKDYIKDDFCFKDDVIETKWKWTAPKKFFKAWKDLMLWLGIDDSITRASRDTFEDIAGYEMTVGGFNNKISRSGNIGEEFKNMLSHYSDGNLVPHPNTNGYPDLLDISTAESKEYFQSILDGNVPKSEYRGYKYGGEEIKACKAKFTKKGKLSIPNVKAHHNQTKNLFLILWEYDSENNRRKLLAAFYAPELLESDWTTMATPGSTNPKTGKVYSVRNTPGCSLNKIGQGKLLSNCLCYLNDNSFIEKLNKAIGYDVRL